MTNLSDLLFEGSNLRGNQGIQGLTGPIGATGPAGLSTGPFQVETITSPHTLSTTDVGKLIKINAGVSTVGLNTITVPASTFSLGDVFLFFNETSPTQTISPGVGVTFYSSTGTANTIGNSISQNGLCSILCLNLNEFAIYGTLSEATAPTAAPNGLTLATAGTSAYQILQDYPSSVDGFYYIVGASGTPVLVYCDMTTDGGGWMLIHQCNGTGTTGATATATTSAVGTISGAVTGTTTGTIPATYKLADADTNYFMNNRVIGTDRPSGHTLPVFRAQINSVTAGGGTIDYFTTNSTGTYTFTDGALDFRGITAGSFSDRGWDTYAAFSAAPTSPTSDGSYGSGAYTGWGTVPFYSYNVWGNSIIYNASTNGFYNGGSWLSTGSMWYR